MNICTKRAYLNLFRRKTPTVALGRYIRGIVLAAIGMFSLQAATWNVNNLGATGNGTTDDTAAIQKAVDSSAPGDTILFPGGSYRLSAPINVQSNQTYQGQSGATLLGASGWYTFATPWDATSNITVNGLIFDGAPLAIQGDTVAASNVQITNCTFQNITSTNNNWTTHQGIFIASGLTDSSITNNTFRNILPNGQTNDTETSWGGGIYGYNLKNTVISGNTCDTVQECMYLKTDAASTYPGIVSSNNTGTNVHRMGIEMQAANCSVQMTGNKFTNFLNPFWDSFGISFAASTCSAVIKNNTLIAMPTATTFGRYGYGIEAWGTGTQVMNNSIQGNWNLGVAIGWSANLTVTGNYLCGSTGAMAIGVETGSQAKASNIQGNTTSLVCRA
jgi:Pectate lyase superfamily protein